MYDSELPQPDDREHDEVDVSSGAGTRRARRHRSRSRISTLGLVTAVVAALVAGPAVASRLAAIGTGPYAGVAQPAEEPGVPVSTTTPENANQREGRTAAPSPTSTGENANQREGRTAEPGCP